MGERNVLYRKQILSAENLSAISIRFLTKKPWCRQENGTYLRPANASAIERSGRDRCSTDFDPRTRWRDAFSCSIVLILRLLWHPRDLRHLPEQVAELVAIELRHCGDPMNLWIRSASAPRNRLKPISPLGCVEKGDRHLPAPDYPGDSNVPVGASPRFQQTPVESNPQFFDFRLGPFLFEQAGEYGREHAIFPRIRLGRILAEA